MHVVVSVLVIIALVLLVIFFMPGACNQNIDQGPGITDDPGNGDNTGNTGGDNIGTGTGTEDNGNTGVNITTGKVKIDIVNLLNQTLLGNILLFEGETETDNVLFHPGETFRTQGFKIKNNGTVTVSYIMNVSRDSSLDMEAFDEAFDFYVTTDPDDLNSAVKMRSFKGVLEPDSVSETYYIVVSMKETAGNEFQDKTFEGIGITVNATQKTED